MFRVNLRFLTIIFIWTFSSYKCR